MDFMVPVRGPNEEASELPTSVFDMFGYGHDFDGKGRSGDLTIHFAAIGAHLAALKSAAAAGDVRINKIIFAPELMLALQRTESWPAIRSLPFVRKPVWVRHDDHYHVDFATRCVKRP